MPKNQDADWSQGGPIRFISALVGDHAVLFDAEGNHMASFEIDADGIFRLVLPAQQEQKEEPK